MKTRYPVAVVFWHDAHNQREDIKLSEIDHEPALQVASGFVVKENSKGITLAMEYADEAHEELRITWFIPRRMIVKVRRFR